MDLNNLQVTGPAAITAIVGLIKNPNIITLLYNDVAHPSMESIGKTLGNVFELCGSITLPLKLINEKLRLNFKRNMDRYIEKLMKEDQTRLIEVPIELGMPIVDKLTYIQDKNISEMFITLLKNASLIEKIDFVHPYFITIINNIAPDEAVLLNNICKLIKQTDDSIPILVIEKFSKIGNKGSTALDKCIISNRYLNGITNKENKHLYIDNLIALGIIEYFNDKYLSSIDEYYQPLLNEFENEIFEIKKNINCDEEEIIIDYGMIEITNTGRKFLRSVDLL